MPKVELRSGLKLFDRPKDCRRRKAHDRYLAERERQTELEGRDTQKAIKDTSAGIANRSSQGW